ncbi:hypothetical protein ACC680_08860 [Rhizobium ruizarguesonis]
MRERVQAALHASGPALPAKRVTVNLASADLPTERSPPFRARCRPPSAPNALGKRLTRPAESAPKTPGLASNSIFSYPAA